MLFSPLFDKLEVLFLILKSTDKLRQCHVSHIGINTILLNLNQLVIY